MNIDPELKKKFQDNCKAFGVDMTTVIRSFIIKFNEESTTPKQK